MTSLQIIDLAARSIGYCVLGVAGLMAAAMVAVVIWIGLQRDDEKRQDD